MTNLSEGGAFLATEESVSVGDKLRLRIFLPGHGGYIETDTQVVWRTCDAGARAHHLPSGIGLAFVEPDPQLQDKLRRYIKRFYELAKRCQEKRR